MKATLPSSGPSADEAAALILRGEGIRGCSVRDFRLALTSIRTELEEIALTKAKLKKEQRMLEMMLYMMFPEEAIHDGYQNVASLVASRMRLVKEQDEKEKADRNPETTVREIPVT